MDRQLQSSSSEVLTIQYLRAAAAILIVFHHAQQFPGIMAAVGTAVGNSGVDIFFVISGFVMAVTAGRANYPVRRFLIRRIIRIVPLYWSLTALTCILLYVAPTLFRDNVFTWKHFILSLLFVPHMSPDTVHDHSPLIKIGWTLNFEMFFYFIFATFMMFKLTIRIVAMTILFAALIVVKDLLHPDIYALRFWANGVLFEFVMGCAVGQLYLSGHLSKVGARAAWIGVAVAIVALLIFGMYRPDVPRVIVSGIPAAVLAAAALCLERNGLVGLSTSWKFLGDASYSIYLTHLLPISVLRKVWTVGNLPTEGLANAVLFIGLSMVSAILCASLTYSYFEKPVLDYLRHRLGFRSRGSDLLAGSPKVA